LCATAWEGVSFPDNNMWLMMRTPALAGGADHTIYGEGQPHTEEDVADATLFDLADHPLEDGQPWRCATCYRSRFETMCFGMNEAGSAVCGAEGGAAACAGQPPSACGYHLRVVISMMYGDRDPDLTGIYVPF
jgi:hypothetical protein